MHSMEVTSNSNRSLENDSTCCTCLTISIGVGSLAFLSIIAGLMVITFASIDRYNAFQNQSEVEIRWKFDKLGYVRNDTLEIGKKAKIVFYGAAVTGIGCGCIQIVTSIWFLWNVRFSSEENEEESIAELGYKANLWILGQLIVLLMLLTIFGAIFIAGFHPNEMIKIFGIDFIIVNLSMLFSVAIIRSKVGQLKKPNRGGEISALFVL